MENIFSSYFNLNQSVLKKESYNKEKLVKLMASAVQKRVSHHKDVAILFSGGIDSTIVLKHASDFKDNIVAYICGNKDSVDKQFAENYCQENNIKYKIVVPKEISEKDLRLLVKILETTDFNIIAHSWVNYLVYEAIKKDGLFVALCGEGADELFGGYNEFTHIDKKDLIH